MGSYKNDLQEGKGVLTFADGSSYDGYWKKDNMEGKGVMKFAVNGTITEAGCAHKVNAGDVYDGEWQDGKRHGACMYTFFNGEVFTCTFVGGVCGEFHARQAAVRAAPDDASVQARAEALRCIAPRRRTAPTAPRLLRRGLQVPRAQQQQQLINHIYSSSSS